MAVTGILNPNTWYTVANGRVPGISRIVPHNSKETATNYAKEAFSRYIVDTKGLKRRSLTGRVSIGQGLYRESPNRQWTIFREVDAIDGQSYFRDSRSTDELSADIPNADFELKARRYGPFIEDSALDFSLDIDSLGSSDTWQVKVKATDDSIPTDLPVGYTYNFYAICDGLRYPRIGYIFNPDEPDTATFYGVPFYLGTTVYCEVLGIDRIDNEYYDINAVYGQYNRDRYREVDTREVVTVVEATVNSLKAALGFGFLREQGYLGTGEMAYNFAATIANPADNTHRWVKATSDPTVKPYDGLSAIVSIRSATWIYSTGNQFPAIVEHENYWTFDGGDTSKAFRDSYDTGGFSTLPLPANQIAYVTHVTTRYALGKPYYEDNQWKYPSIIDIESIGAFSPRKAQDNTDLTIAVQRAIRVKHRRGIEIPGLPQSRLVMTHDDTSISFFIETEGVAGNPFGGEDLTQFGVSFGFSFSGTSPKFGVTPIADIWGFSPMSATKAATGLAGSVRTAISSGNADDIRKAVQGVAKAADTVVKIIYAGYGTKPNSTGRVDR